MKTTAPFPINRPGSDGNMSSSTANDRKQELRALVQLEVNSEVQTVEKRLLRELDVRFDKMVTSSVPDLQSDNGMEVNVKTALKELRTKMMLSAKGEDYLGHIFMTNNQLNTLQYGLHIIFFRPASMCFTALVSR
jgi:hypothetical protein